MRNGVNSSLFSVTPYSAMLGDCGRDSLRALARLDLSVDHMLRRPTCCCRLNRLDDDVALVRCPVGLLDGPQPGGDPGLAGGDGLAVAPAVGVFGQVLAGPLDLAEVGFSLVGVGGDGVDGDVGSGGIEDEGNYLAFGIPPGQGEWARTVALWPGLLGEGGLA